MPWAQGLQGNQLLSYDTFYISYRPLRHKDEVLQMFEAVGAMMGTRTGKGPETALYERETGIWRILNGDFRQVYEYCGDNFEVCLTVYHDNIQHRSDWSTDEVELM